MGGAPYLGLKLGGGPTFQQFVLCVLLSTQSSVTIVRRRGLSTL